MQKITVQLTAEELQALVTLTENQFFRIKYLDPKMPGYKGDPAELAMGKDLVLRLKCIAREASGSAVTAVSRRAASHLSPNRNGVPDAV